ncbi:MAG TPA: hypothetical protein VLV48_01330 [Thermoanaerobaculia bacterium]|nr:hypothetical protein [Thermoanaerobaculia bacterium]
MKRANAIAALLLLAAALTGCRSSEFSKLVRAVEAEPGTRRQYIPMLALARTGVRTIHPHGIRDFQLAIFETEGVASSARLDAAIREAGDGWTPMIRVERADGERTSVWARPAKGTMEMLVLAHEPGESVIVRLEMAPEEFFAALSDSPGDLARTDW